MRRAILFPTALLALESPMRTVSPACTLIRSRSSPEGAASCGGQKRERGAGEEEKREGGPASKQRKPCLPPPHFRGLLPPPPPAPPQPLGGRFRRTEGAERGRENTAGERPAGPAEGPTVPVRFLDGTAVDVPCRCGWGETRPRACAAPAPRVPPKTPPRRPSPTPSPAPPSPRPPPSTPRRPG